MSRVNRPIVDWHARIAVSKMPMLAWRGRKNWQMSKIWKVAIFRIWCIMAKTSQHVLTTLLANAYKNNEQPSKMQRLTSIRTIKFQIISVQNVQLRHKLSVQRCKQILSPDGKHMFESSKFTGIGTQQFVDWFRFLFIPRNVEIVKTTWGFTFKSDFRKTPFSNGDRHCRIWCFQRIHKNQWKINENDSFYENSVCFDMFAIAHFSHICRCQPRRWNKCPSTGSKLCFSLRYDIIKDRVWSKHFVWKMFQPRPRCFKWIFMPYLSWCRSRAQALTWPAHLVQLKHWTVSAPVQPTPLVCMRAIV